MEIREAFIEKFSAYFEVLYFLSFYNHLQSIRNMSLNFIFSKQRTIKAPLKIKEKLSLNQSCLRITMDNLFTYHKSMRLSLLKIKYYY